LRAAADLIDRSGMNGLSVSCHGGDISIQVSADSGDAEARAATVARLGGLLGGTAVQDDDRNAGRSWIRARGTAGGLPVEVFTAVTVQEAGEDDARGQRRLLAASPDGRIAQTAPPVRLPAGWRWLTELDPAPAVVAAARSSSDAARIAARDCPRLTSAALQASRPGASAEPPARPGTTVHPAPPRHPR
jgi:hypothetical protein